jgi:PAS domain-containing protein
LALRSVGPESEAESVRFHGRRVTKGGARKSKAAAGGLGAAEQGVREAHSGAAAAGAFCRRKDGCEFPVEIGINPVESEEGTLVLSVIVDITERRQAEAEARELRDELAHVTRVTTLSELFRLAGARAESTAGHHPQQCPGGATSPRAVAAGRRGSARHSRGHHWGGPPRR